MNISFLSIKLFPTSALILLIFSLFSISCRKTYIEKFNIVPGDTVTVSGYNHIKSFTVHEFSADTPISATITNDSIIVYWPSYRNAPATIKPEISVPEKTVISPATGTEIPFVEGTKFTVTAESGQKKVYNLRIDYSQPKPWFRMSAASFTVGNPVTLNGDWYLQDFSKTKIYLVSAETKVEYEAELITFTPNPVFITPLNAPVSGFYNLKVVNGKHTIYSSDPTGIDKLTLNVNPTKRIHSIGTATAPFIVKAGGQFTIRGYDIAATSSAQMGVSTTRNPTALEIVTTAIDRVTFKVPVGTPAALYRGMRLTLSDDTAQPFNSAIYIMVTE